MIEGETVTLAPLEAADSEALFRWINDRELVQLNAPFQPVRRADHERWFERIRNSEDTEVFAIRRNRDDRLIGSCQLRRIDADAGSCELQIRIGERSVWGQGHGTEAVRLLLARAFGPLGLSRVELEVFAGNERAIRSYRSAGFREVEVRPGAALIEGAETDVVLMEAREEHGDGG